ncbi:hypothetical protein B0H14DRAFT_2757183 [Mycena olivaceomarginata]|nr:hypothetical protein B0H14DRAFT_2757183 [Mycena olivaceomarginata]
MDDGFKGFLGARRSGVPCKGRDGDSVSVCPWSDRDATESFKYSAADRQRRIRRIGTSNAPDQWRPPAIHPFRVFKHNSEKGTLSMKLPSPYIRARGQDRRADGPASNFNARDGWRYEEVHTDECTLQREADRHLKSRIKHESKRATWQEPRGGTYQLALTCRLTVIGAGGCVPFGDWVYKDQERVFLEDMGLRAHEYGLKRLAKKSGWRRTPDMDAPDYKPNSRVGR